VLKTVDQFGACLVPVFIVIVTANLVLQDTVERIYVDGAYADLERGTFLIRGENVVLLGELVCTCMINTMTQTGCYKRG
jgi:hypothetical protein